MVRPAPQGQQDSDAAKRSLRRRPARDPRELLTCQIKLRGGPEAWVEIRTRGGLLRVPGYTHIAEVLMRLNNCD
jgi:hypothetical protein